MNNVYTENLAEIMSCHCERLQVQNIITEWNTNGLPDSFYEEGVRFAYNRNSGYVFLVNDEYEVLMLNEDGNLEQFYSSPYDGKEGFKRDLIEWSLNNSDDWHSEDLEWLSEL